MAYSADSLAGEKSLFCSPLMCYMRILETAVLIPAYFTIYDLRFTMKMYNNERDRPLTSYVTLLFAEHMFHLGRAAGSAAIHVMHMP